MAQPHLSPNWREILARKLAEKPDQPIHRLVTKTRVSRVFFPIYEAGSAAPFVLIIKDIHMKTIPSLLASATLLVAASFPAVASTTICEARGLPQLTLRTAGGMGTGNNTLQVGNAAPVRLDVGSQFPIATYRGREYIFSLRRPANVQIGSKTHQLRCRAN